MVVNAELVIKWKKLFVRSWCSRKHERAGTFLARPLLGLARRERVTFWSAWRKTSEKWNMSIQKNMTIESPGVSCQISLRFTVNWYTDCSTVSFPVCVTWKVFNSFPQRNWNSVEVSLPTSFGLGRDTAHIHCCWSEGWCDWCAGSGLHSATVARAKQTLSDFTSAFNLLAKDEILHSLAYGQILLRSPSFAPEDRESKDNEIRQAKNCQLKKVEDQADLDISWQRCTNVE